MLKKKGSFNVFKKTTFILLLFLLSGCGTRVEPMATAPTYQGSPTIIVNPTCKENCGGATVDIESKAESTPTIKQDAEATTKSGMWIFWVILLVIGVICGMLAYFYFKKVSLKPF
jgi:heme/copper-type cytochrome/quinol oxidase subunit 2